MPTEVSVKLVITGEAGDLQSKLKAIEAQMRSLNGGGGAGGGNMFSAGTQGAETFQQALRGLIGRFSALWATMKSAEGMANVFNIGVKFNSVMEDSRLGIGSLIVAQSKLTDSSGKELQGREALTAAMKLGDDQIQKLRVSGLQTAATTEQLTSAYQDAVGGGLRAGMSLDQIRKLTVQTVQAAGAMGVPMNQLNQEIRSILDGTIDRNSRVAIRLGITNADVEKWKQAGTLFSELNKRMDAFSEAGKESMNNWTVLLSNMAEASQILMGDAFKAPMKNIQASLSSVMNMIVDIESAGLSDKIQPVLLMLKDLGALFGDFVVASIKAVTDSIMAMGEWWAKNREAIDGALSSFRVFASDAFSALGTVFKTLIWSLAESFLWFNKLPEPLKAASIAVGTFTVALIAMNAEIAGKLAIQIGVLIKKVAELAQVAAYASSFGLAGLKYAIMSLVDPVVLVIAGVAALAAGIYYLSTQKERAAQAALDLAKNSKDATEQYNRLGASAKSLDDESKQQNMTKAEAASLDARRKILINDIIKLAPNQIAMIKDEIEKGTSLAEVWRKVAAEKMKSIQADIVMAEAKNKQEAKRIADRAATIEATSEGGGGLSGIKARISLMAESFTGTEAAYELEVKRIQVMKDELLTLQAQYAESEKTVRITANKLDDAKKAKQAEKERHDLQMLILQVEQMGIDAMPRRTAAEREEWEIRKAKHSLSVEEERIKHSEISINDKAQQQRLAALITQNRIKEIQEDYIQRRQDAEERWDTYVKGQEGDTLARKISGLQKQLAAEEKRYQVATGLMHSEAELASVLAERTARETTAFREQEMKKLEAAMKDLEKTKGYTFNFEQQKAALEELRAKLNLSEEALSGLNKKLKEINQRKGDFSGGLLAGLTEAADAMTNKFEQAKSAIKSILSSTENAFSTFFQNIIQKGMTGAQKWDSLWKTISGAVLKALTEIMAKQLVAWGIDKAIAIWKTGRSTAEVIEQGTTAGATVSSALAKSAAIGIEATAAKVAAPALIELAVAETWAAYAGMPLVGMGLATAQISAIMTTYGAAKALSFMGGGIGSGAPAEASTGMNYPGYALGGVITKPTFALMGEAGREVVAPENTFLDWIKNVASPAIRVPSGGFGIPGQSEYAFAGMGSRSTSIHANFDGALIIGDSADGLRKAASALRVIKKYDDRMNG